MVGLTYASACVAAYVRFGVNANFGLGGTPAINIRSMVVSSRLPTYWRYIGSGGMATPGKVFLSSERAAHPNDWKQVTLGVEVDYEPGDGRVPTSGPSPTNWSVTMFQALSDLLHPEGYFLVLSDVQTSTPNRVILDNFDG